MAKKVLVSGIQSSGRLHLGNYFGAMKQNIAIGNTDDYESYIFIADYHSMTSLTDAKERQKSSFDIACAYLACGLNTEKVTLFRQSSVPSHTELSWTLSTVTPMPMLMLAHSFKDKEAKNADINAGLFTYPILMAADILMYNADLVPVGKDQIQHVEITREIAGKFNRAYNVDFFTTPKEFIQPEVAIVPGIDGEKMSKSKGNVIPLFGTDEEIRKAVMSIVTDSARPEDKKDPDTNNIYNIHKLFLDEKMNVEIRNRYEIKNPNIDKPIGYKEAKDLLYESIIAFISPLREKYNYYQSNPDIVHDILKKGGERARAKAEETMKSVREITGLV